MNKVFVIVEAGVNHNGDIELAKKLIDVAVDAGADAVKFQTFKAELIVTKNAEQADYQKDSKEESQFEMLKKLELSEKEFHKLKKYCDEKGIEFLSTPHSDKWSVDLLEKLGMSMYKIGSGDLTNLPFLKYVAKTGKPILLSTGMATLEEIKEAKQTIEGEGNSQITILQCTTMYPCPYEKANVRMMEFLRRETGCVVGYSDHTEGIEASIIATCLGAKVIEKHFTLDKNMEGPDHKASADPEELKTMIKAIKLVEDTDPEKAFSKLNELGYKLDFNVIKTILGKDEKKPEPEELEVAKVARKSIVALDTIKEGEELTEVNTGIRRPGEGLAPKYFDQVIGKKAVKNIEKDQYIMLSDAV